MAVAEVEPEDVALEDPDCVRDAVASPLVALMWLPVGNVVEDADTVTVRVAEMEPVAVPLSVADCVRRALATALLEVAIVGEGDGM